MKDKLLEVKRNQHYVWAKYLKRWSFNNRDVYYTTSKGKVIHDSVRLFAMEKDFYRVTFLTQESIDVIKMFLKPLSKSQQNTYLSLLNDILKIQYIQTLHYREKKNSQQADKLFLATRCNLMENLHGTHENRTIQIIEELANGELEVLESDQKIGIFTSFLGLQLFRTKKVKDAFLKKLDGNKKLDKYVFALKNTWWFLSYVLGLSLGTNLFLDRKNNTHSLLTNDSRISFITSDQPVINIHACVSSDQPPEYADIYYPLSPNRAYLISKSQYFPSGKIEITAQEAHKLNVKMAKNYNIHLIGNEEDLLRKYIKNSVK